MTDMRQREWLVAFRPRWDRHEETEAVILAPRWWDVSTALLRMYPFSVIQGVWAILDWPEEESSPQPRRKDGLEPCAECHLNPGEVCDICGAKEPEREAEEL